MLNEVNCTSDLENVAVRVKAPSRVLHFSDGIIEEFSEEEIDPVEPETTLPLDESKMTWGPWLMHKAKETGTVVLAKCDSMGEYLAETLGITSPKYSYEIELHKQMQAEQARVAQKDAESANWSEVRQLDDGATSAADSTDAVVLITSEGQINKY